MEIAWLGHSCFRLRGREAVVLMDPYEKSVGYSLGRPSAEIVTISHAHPGHNGVSAVAGSPKVIQGPGEYEIANVLIAGLPTFHDEVQGQKLGKNTVYFLQLEEVNLCHLGDLGHVPSAEQLEELSEVDVLFIPVGGVTTINAVQAAEMVRLLDPKLVVPMHFRTEKGRSDLDPVSRFLQEMGLKDVAVESRVNVSRSNLPKETRVVVLEQRR